MAKITAAVLAAGALVGAIYQVVESADKIRAALADFLPKSFDNKDFQKWADTPPTANEEKVRELHAKIYEESTAWEIMYTVPQNRERLVENLEPLCEEMDEINTNLNENHLIVRDEYSGFGYHMIADAKYLMGDKQDAYKFAEKAEEILHRALVKTQDLKASSGNDDLRNFLITDLDEERIKYLLARNYALLHETGIGNIASFGSEAKQTIESIDTSKLNQLNVNVRDPVSEPYLSKILSLTL